MAHWIYRDVEYFGEIVSHECCCSNCGYVVMKYSHMIQDIRAGKPYDLPSYKHCNNCGESMEEAK